ncbi:hypothetical protein FQR65_LT07583 [Abscondita terminalis]|nr:hypothetical protein FQR65_LT07583 [Abscondita terminalis]
MNLHLMFIILFWSGSVTDAFPLDIERECPGFECDIFRAIVMKILIAFFDFNCMYTNYLGNVTACLCDPLETCIGERYNECLRQEFHDTDAAKECSYVKMHIVNVQETDFNCFPTPELLDYRDCVCEEWRDEDQGAKHNRCFQDVFWI